MPANRNYLGLLFGLAVTMLSTPLDAQTTGLPSADLVRQPWADCGKAVWARQLAADGKPGGPSDPGNGPRDPDELFSDTDVLHYQIDIELLPAAYQIQGTTTLTVKSLVEGLTQFSFKLHSNQTISSTFINGATPLTPTLTGANAYSRIVNLDRVYHLNEIFALTISYSGPPTGDSWGGMFFSSAADGSPFIYTLCEPWMSGVWFACKDGAPSSNGDNSDKATVDTNITAPDALRSISNGVLVGEETLSGGRKRYRWSSSSEMPPYLMCLASATYHTWTDTFNWAGGTMPAEFNVLPEYDSPANRAGWDKSLTMLSTYGQLYGTYPFTSEKFGVYQFGWGGGMEHQTNIGLCCFDEWILAHETAHQWWGDNVTCRYWNDIWLNEGFATYSEALYFQYKPGSSGWPDYFYWMNVRRPPGVAGSVYVYDTSNVGNIFSYLQYQKAAWVLHMLRHTIGDTAFFDSLLTYRAQYEGGTAITDDFKGVVEAVSGRSLGYFFNQWIYGSGAPTYQYGWQSVNIGGQNYLRFYLNQVQTVSYPTFTMPVDLRLTTSAGDQSVTVWNDARTQWFVVPIAAPATAIAVDENNWILNEGKAEVAYLAGPPKIVQTTPAIGSLTPAGAGAPSQLQITFSEPVSASAANFAVSGRAGPVPFGFSYDPNSLRATLNFGAPLTFGVYTVTIGEGVHSVAADAVLDGEIADPNTAASLPSGNGLPGGAAVFNFAISPTPCADLNGNHLVELGDLAIALGAYGMAGADLPADFDHSGLVDISDLAWLLATYGLACP